MTDPAHNYTTGQRLAEIYTLRQEAPGHESFATIWLAYDEVLGKEISLHFLPAAVRGDARAMGELREEVRRNRQLIHPNILRVYDFIEEADWAAISMDWFEGESLAALRRKKEGGFFEPAEVKPWLAEICPALDDVHKINLAHGDLAPRNLLLEKSGKLLVANFGISRVIEEALERARQSGGSGGDGGEAAADRRLAYLSPQQLDGEPLTSADDVYALGATVYELLAGEPPFTGADMVVKIRRTAPEPMMERRAKLGKRGGTVLPAWETAVAACLNKKAEARPRRLTEFAGKLGVGASAERRALVGPGSAGGMEGATAAAPIPFPAPPGSNVKEARPEDASAKSFTDIAAAVEADERAAELEMLGPGPANVEKAGSGSRKGASSFYPDLYPKPSRVPTLIIAACAVFLVVGGIIWHMGGKHADQGDMASEGENTDHAPAITDDNAPGKTGDKNIASNDSSEPVIDGPSLTDPPDRTSTAATAGSGSGTGAVKSGQTTPALGSSPASSIGAATLLAQNHPPASPAPPASGSRPSAGAPAPSAASTPAPAPSRPVPASNAAQGSAPPAQLDASAPVDKLQQAADAAEKRARDARASQQQAEAAAASAKAALEARAKTLAPALTAAAELAAQRKQREDQLKAAELAAQQARQALSDWEKQNQPKAVAREAADAELQALQKKVEEKQQAAAAAVKIAAEAAEAAQKQTAALEQSRQAEKTRAAEETRKAAATQAKRAQLDAETRKMQELQEALNRQMQQLEQIKKELGASSGAAVSTNASTPAAGASPPSTSPTPPAATPQPKRAGPAPNASPAPGAGAHANTTAPPAVAEASSRDPLLAMAATGTPSVSMIPQNSAPESGGARTTGAAAPTVAFENTLGMKFVAVGKVFFCIWPTRVQDFAVFARETSLASNSWRNPGFQQTPDHPVVNVSWNDAIAFCKWLTERERKQGLLSAAQYYRLPTDMEWSKAAGLPDETGKTPAERDMDIPNVFPWGTQWPPPPNAGNYTGQETGSEVAIEGYDDGYAYTSPVGSFPPNAAGLYDMGGNVCQWCMDRWNSTTPNRVLRGGSWYSALKLSLLSSCRLNASPEKGTDNYGFRIVRTSGKG